MVFQKTPRCNKEQTAEKLLAANRALVWQSASCGEGDGRGNGFLKVTKRGLAWAKAHPARSRQPGRLRVITSSGLNIHFLPPMHIYIYKTVIANWWVSWLWVIELEWDKFLALAFAFAFPTSGQACPWSKQLSLKIQKWAWVLWTHFGGEAREFWKLGNN